MSKNGGMIILTKQKGGWISMKRSDEKNTTAGNPDLLHAARNSKTAAKYDVSNETVSTDNLQKKPKQ